MCELLVSKKVVLFVHRKNHGARRGIIGDNDESPPPGGEESLIPGGDGRHEAGGIRLAKEAEELHLAEEEADRIRLANEEEAVRIRLAKEAEELHLTFQLTVELRYLQVEPKFFSSRKSLKQI